MKKRKIINIYLLAAILLSLTACHDEYDTGKGAPRIEEKIQVKLFVDAGDFQKPLAQTKSAMEEQILGRMPWVFVFRGNDDNAIFEEASLATPKTNTPMVYLTRTNSPSRLLILANPPDRFFDGTTDGLELNSTAISNALSGKTYAQAINILNTARLNSPQEQNLYTGDYIPMTATWNLSSIDGQTTIGSSGDKIQLERIVAKVTVNSYADFIIEGFTVIGANRYGRLFPSLASPTPKGSTTNYIASAPADPVSGIATSLDAVYIYPASSSDATSVIIKGKFNSVTGYYRVVFKDSGTGKLLDIVQNKWYQFNLTKVDGPGYSTLETALKAKPSNNITAELLVTDRNSMEIVDNGQFYLGLTNSEVIVYSGTEETKLHIATLMNNAPAGTYIHAGVQSSSPEGTLNIIPGNMLTNGTVTASDIKANLSKSFSSGTIRLTVGNLTRNITIKRENRLTPQGGVLQFSPNYVSAKIESLGSTADQWITLSADGVNYSDKEVVNSHRPGIIYLRIGENKPGGIMRKNGIVCLTRNNNQGHLKLYINQAPNLPKENTD